jgi:MFS family permease
LDDRYIIPSMWMGLWNAISPIGIMMGSIFIGWLQDRIGRRLAFGLSSLLSAGGVALVYSSHFFHDLESRRGAFLAAKLIQGSAIGGVLCTAQTYLSEILPPKLRGSVMAFFPVFTLLGQLIGAVVVYTSLDFPGKRPYTTPMIAQWPFSAVPLVVSIILPESPTFLLRKGKVDQAFKAQQRLDGPKTNTQQNINNIKFALQKEEEQASHDQATYTECFRGTNLRRTLIVIFANSLPQLFGLSLLADSSYFIQVVGMSAHNALLFLQLGVALGLLSNIASMWVVTKVGRRPLGLTTLSIATLLWFGMGIAGIFNGVVTIWYAAVTMMIVIVSLTPQSHCFKHQTEFAFQITVGVGIWPVSYVVGAETSALRLRAKTQGIGWCAGALAQGTFGISLPYMYNIDQGDLRAKAGFVIAGFSLLAFVVTWLFVPEMKERTPAEIDAMFERRLPARQFKYWRGTTAGRENPYGSEAHLA